MDLVKVHMSIVPVIGFVELLGGEANLVGCIRTCTRGSVFVLAWNASKVVVLSSENKKGKS